METPCIRCGKTRIVKREWKEIVDRGTPIVHIETVCPDPECQKIVDAQFAEIRQKRELQESKKTSVKI